MLFRSDDVAPDKLAAFETAFHRFMSANHPEIGRRIAAEKELKADLEEHIKTAIAEFKKGMVL